MVNEYDFLKTPGARRPRMSSLIGNIKKGASRKKAPFFRVSITEDNERYSALMLISLGFASSTLGSVKRSSPSLNTALIFDESTIAGRVNVLLNAP